MSLKSNHIPGILGGQLAGDGSPPYVAETSYERR